MPFYYIVHKSALPFFRSTKRSPAQASAVQVKGVEGRVG